MTCKSVIINNCGCGEGKSPYIGENGNWFLWDGTEWIDSGVKAQGSGSADNLPWCSGYFQNRSLPAGVFSILTPDAPVIGDKNMVQGNKFIAPEDGIYQLIYSGGGVSIASELWSLIRLNTEIAELGGDSTAAVAQTFNNGPIPFVSAIKYLKKNEYFTVFLYSTAAQTTIQQDMILPQYTFVRLR